MGLSLTGFPFWELGVDLPLSCCPDLGLHLAYRNGTRAQYPNCIECTPIQGRPRPALLRGLLHSHIHFHLAFFIIAELQSLGYIFFLALSLSRFHFLKRLGQYLDRLDREAN